MQLRRLKALAGATAILAVTGGGAAAQGVTISPLVGVYSQANSVDQLRAQADTLSIKRQSALALGANIEIGFLRGSLNYVSGATVKQSGGTTLPGTSGDIGTGRILMGAADLVLRPIPRIIVLQPYGIAGIGFKKFDYDTHQNVSSAIGSVKNNSTASFHAGIGADLMFGGVGLVAEITDYISQGEADTSGHRDLQHDAFGLVGLRLRVF
jgi:opacity protein-like surface antigen